MVRIEPWAENSDARSARFYLGMLVDVFIEWVANRSSGEATSGAER